MLLEDAGSGKAGLGLGPRRKSQGAFLEPDLSTSPSLTQLGPGEATCIRQTRAFQDVIRENSSAHPKGNASHVRNFKYFSSRSKKRKEKQAKFILLMHGI